LCQWDEGGKFLYIGVGSEWRRGSSQFDDELLYPFEVFDVECWASSPTSGHLVSNLEEA
jgi:hypothetical protein